MCPAEFRWPPKVAIFGVKVSVTDYVEATAAIVAAARLRQSAIVACQAVHALITAGRDPSLREKVNGFELVTPDGQPVRWAMNLLHGTGLTDASTARSLCCACAVKPPRSASRFTSMEAALRC